MTDIPIYKLTQTEEVIDAVLLKAEDFVKGYTFAGNKTPTDSPLTESVNVFYFVLSSGTYSNFGNLVISEPGFIYYTVGSGYSFQAFSFEGSGIAGVTSINNLTGVVNITTDDIPEGVNNKYFTGTIPTDLNQLDDSSNLIGSKASSNNVLLLDNTNPYNPTQNYHPTTKKFVEEYVSSFVSSNPISNTSTADLAYDVDWNTATLPPIESYVDFNNHLNNASIHFTLESIDKYTRAEIDAIANNLDTRLETIEDWLSSPSTTDGVTKALFFSHIYNLSVHFTMEEMFDYVNQNISYENLDLDIQLSDISTSDISFGNLYNKYALDNIANTGWRVPNESDFETLISNTSLQDLQSTKIEHWNIPGTDLYKFSARGSGNRNTDGSYSNFKDAVSYWSTTAGSGSTNKAFDLITGEITDHDYKEGNPIVLIKNTTNLSHGQTGTYIGNDGTVYPTICIFGQEWLARPLSETKTNTNITIPNVEDEVEWSNLTTLGLSPTNGNSDNTSNSFSLEDFYVKLEAAYLHSLEAHAPSNANANIQSDWNQTDTNADDYIKNKPASQTINSLDDIDNGVTYVRITATHYTDLSDGGESTLHYHSSDRNRSNHTGTQLLSTISDAGSIASKGFWSGSQASYDGLGSYNNNTIYFITGS